MHFLKSETYNLTPDQYLEKFRKPHSQINSKGSIEEDLKDNALLSDILQKYYNDNSKSLQTKQQTVNELSEIINNWIKEYSNESDMSPVKLKPNKPRNSSSAEGKQVYSEQPTNRKQDIESKSQGNYIQTGEQPIQKESQQNCHYGLKIFGSYSLKANSYDGDIDMVVVVPDHFSRQKHFFKVLVQKFKNNKNISEVLAIPDAVVPLIRLTVNKIQIDLLMSRIPASYIDHHPDFFESTERSSINQKQLRSINGYRTSLYLMKNVPKFDNFQLALKALKMWAKNKGVYSQIYGYLGGAAFSIMLAKIAQLYPNYSSLALLDRFFFIYSQWVWSIPIKIEQGTEQDNSQTAIAIFTPLQPHMNSAHSFSKITHNITKKYLSEAAKVIQQIRKGNKTWKQLFRPVDFFTEYRSFLQISVMGNNQEDFIPWKGNVESRLRKLIRWLEMQHQLVHGVEVNPYPKSFESKHKDYQYCNRYYIGFNCAANYQINDYSEIDLTQPVRNFLDLLEAHQASSRAPQIVNVGFEYLEQESIPEDVLKQMRHYYDNQD